MKYPQTIAEKLAKNIQSIADNACCAFTALWCLGVEVSDEQAIALVSEAISIGVLEKDCTVKWVDFAWFAAKKKITVDFKKCTDISKIRERTPVKYTYNGKSHWVGVENGKIRFNSLINSVCVTRGKPVEMRVIKMR